MMKAIVCVDNNWAIGNQNNLLFNIKEDMARFKDITMGKTIVYGRKTLESFPGMKPLPGRKNIVMTKHWDKLDHKSLFGAKYAGFFLAPPESEGRGRIRNPDIDEAEYRSSFVVRRNPEVKTPNNRTMIFWVEDLRGLLDAVEIIGSSEDTVVCGGEQIYRLLLPYCDTVYVTKVDAEAPAYDATFPNLDEMDDWKVVEDEDWRSNGSYNFKFMTYMRK